MAGAETTGPETIWDALTNLGAERIEHGITTVRDPRLLAHLADLARAAVDASYAGPEIRARLRAEIGAYAPSSEVGDRA